jgi:hypothetical protein
MGNRSTTGALIGGALGLVLAGLPLGCGGQSKFMEDEDWSREPLPDGGAWREVESLGAAARATKATDGRRHLNAVRLDLTMAAQAEPTARCTCLDVMVGRPGDPGFQWAVDKPELDPDQIVLAVRTEGAQCPVGTPPVPIRRPSIRAVDRVGGDVVVVVEDLPVGRPLALGAVTTMPEPGGSVYLRPSDRKLPYGAPPGSREMCKIFSRQGTVRQP